MLTVLCLRVRFCLQWFQQHSECPVTDCRCRCMSLDLLASNGTGGGSLKTIETSVPSGRTNETEAMMSANSILAHQQSQYHQQMSAEEQQRASALQQINAQYPQGLPLDVIALAQAIQLLNLTRGATGNNVPAGVSSLVTSPDSLTPQLLLASPTSAPPNLQAIHQSHSSPGIYNSDAASSGIPSPSSSHESTTPRAHHQHSHTAGQLMQRAGSSVQLGGRQQPVAAPAQVKGNFPLTRW